MGAIRPYNFFFLKYHCSGHNISLASAFHLTSTAHALFTTESTENHRGSQSDWLSQSAQRLTETHRDLLNNLLYVHHSINKSLWVSVILCALRGEPFLCEPLCVSVHSVVNSPVWSLWLLKEVIPEWFYSKAYTGSMFWVNAALPSYRKVIWVLLPSMGMPLAATSMVMTRRSP